VPKNKIFYGRKKGRSPGQNWETRPSGNAHRYRKPNTKGEPSGLEQAFQTSPSTDEKCSRKKTGWREVEILRGQRTKAAGKGNLGVEPENEMPLTNKPHVRGDVQGRGRKAPMRKKELAYSARGSYIRRGKRSPSQST